MNSCLKHRCSRCCHNTEMMLTESDIKRIEKLGYSNFWYELDGFLFLKNINGKCIFLGRNGLCTIYQHRPEGCRYYPYICDPETMEIYVDEECPYAAEFLLDKPNALKELVKKLFEERARRLIRKN